MKSLMGVVPSIDSLPDELTTAEKDKIILFCMSNGASFDDFDEFYIYFGIGGNIALTREELFDHVRGINKLEGFE